MAFGVGPTATADDDPEMIGKTHCVATDPGLSTCDFFCLADSRIVIVGVGGVSGSMSCGGANGDCDASGGLECSDSDKTETSSDDGVCTITSSTANGFVVCGLQDVNPLP